MTDYSEMLWPNIGLMGIRTEVRALSGWHRFRSRFGWGMERGRYEVALLTRNDNRFIFGRHRDEKVAFAAIEAIEDAGRDGGLLDLMAELSRHNKADFLRPLKANTREAQEDYSLLIPGDVVQLVEDHTYQDASGEEHALAEGSVVTVKDVLFDKDHTVIAHDSDDNTYMIPTDSLGLLVPDEDRDGREYGRTYLLTHEAGWQRLAHEEAA